MGELADDVVEGRRCSSCGRWLTADSGGVPQDCGECARENRPRVRTPAQIEKRRRYRRRRKARLLEAMRAEGTS